MFAKLFTRKVQSVVEITVHAEVAADMAAEVAYGDTAALESLAAEHADCTDSCKSYVAAEIARRTEWNVF